MKRTTLVIAVCALIMSATAFYSCQSSAQKEEAAKANVEKAQNDLKQTQAKADEEAKNTREAEELKVFKSETDLKIKRNEIQITELRLKMKTSGKTMDKIHSNKIDELEQKNKDLKTRIDAYDKSQSNWEEFKREFNHDMDELGNAFRDLTVDNKK